MRAGGQDGLVTVQYVAVVGFSLLLFTLLANLVVFQYARGAVRASLDEAARAGARTVAAPAAAVGRCRATAEDARRDYLGGALGRQIVLGCHLEGGLVVATAEVRWDAWLPGMPDWSFTAAASAARETAP